MSPEPVQPGEPAPADSQAPDPVSLPRAALGGLLMGLANLVPGISGGTMLLAAGVYPRFIVAVSDVTRLALRVSTLTFLGVLVGVAAATVTLLAGPVRDVVVGYRWVMYSLFVGLTLGGVPVLMRLAGRVCRKLTIGAAAGFAAMAVLAAFQHGSIGSGPGLAGDPGMLLVAGAAGAASMILPGISGGYLLLVLGQYVAILSAIDRAQLAARTGDLATLVDVGTRALLPVAVGVVIGVAVVSNLVRYFLRRHRRATLGVLLGLLLGAVVGLWPFQQGVPPIPGETVIRGEVVSERTASSLDPEDWPVETFRPSTGQALGALALIAVGIALTQGVARVGGGGRSGEDGRRSADATRI